LDVAQLSNEDMEIINWELAALMDFQSFYRQSILLTKDRFLLHELELKGNSIATQIIYNLITYFIRKYPKESQDMAYPMFLRDNQWLNYTMEDFLRTVSNFSHEIE
jgi:hypothetical protein